MSVTPESVKALLDSDNFVDRIKGINQLSKLEVKTAFSLVQSTITDSNTRVRYAAVSQLDTLGLENKQEALEILRDRLFNDPETDVQAAAADAIGGLKLTEAFEDLQRVYHQTDEWLIKVSIVAALGEFGDPRGFTMLQEALVSKNSLLQTVAIGSMGELGDPRAVDELVGFAESDDWQMRYRLVQALAKLGGDKAYSTIAKLSEDPSEQVASEAKKYRKVQET